MANLGEVQQALLDAINESAGRVKTATQSDWNGAPGEAEVFARAAKSAAEAYRQLGDSPPRYAD